MPCPVAFPSEVRLSPRSLFSAVFAARVGRERKSAGSAHLACAKAFPDRRRCRRCACRCSGRLKLSRRQVRFRKKPAPYQHLVLCNCCYMHANLACVMLLHACQSGPCKLQGAQCATAYTLLWLPPANSPCACHAPAAMHACKSLSFGFALLPMLLLGSTWCLADRAAAI